MGPSLYRDHFYSKNSAMACLQARTVLKRTPDVIHVERRVHTVQPEPLAVTACVRRGCGNDSRRICFIRRAVRPRYDDAVPVLILLIAVLVVVCAILLLAPLTLFLRYRAGRARQRARPWIARLNIAALFLSVVLCMASAMLMEIWTPHVTRYAIAGGGIGVLLGMLALALARWEVTREGLYFQPNAWLVLLVTLVVAGRIAYAAWRTWDAWQTDAGQMSETVAYGVRGSLAAAAVVLGYYTTFWIGVTRRLAEQQFLGNGGPARHVRYHPD